MKSLFLILSLITGAAQAHGACLERAEEAGSSILCIGSEVLYRDSQHEYRSAVVESIYSNGLVGLKSRSEIVIGKLLRNHTEVSVAVQCTGGFCVKEPVFLKSAPQAGRIIKLFANGKAFVSASYGGYNYGRYYSLRDMEPATLTEAGGFSAGDKVLVDSQSDFPVVATVRWLSKNKAEVYYKSNLGKVTRQLPFNEMAKEVGCYQSLCKDTLVLISNYEGESTDAKVTRVFANGRLLIKYLDRGYPTYIWKNAIDVPLKL